MLRRMGAQEPHSLSRRPARRGFDRAQMDMHVAIQQTLQEETDTLNDQVERMARGQGR
ncbi:hypothetical protein [uncultured Algimonas sp.]|uniref:hypothetical protein n=1 Tax=uncultured Algimonas sp. TaxID=1547920 RepID=UPI002616024A|nr:hypothetical protein [uncultured Algimonas sp.]